MTEDLFTGIGLTAIEDERIITYSSRLISMYGTAENQDIIKILIEATVSVLSPSWLFP